MEGTIWALVPPILAIALALITKEVYLSLLAGICVGALLYTDFAVGAAMETTVNIMSGKVDKPNIKRYIIICNDITSDSVVNIVVYISNSVADTNYLSFCGFGPRISCMILNSVQNLCC